jgi:general secretion pathway protein K
VLWISAALAAIAFSLSNTVRGETDRTSTAVDGLRAYYLAQGAVQRAYMELLWSVEDPANRPLPRYSTAVDYIFATGNARVTIVPEAGKLDVNSVPGNQLFRLCLALGMEEERAREITAAILDWRSPATQGSAFDSFYLSLTPSFRAPHASLQEIEELLQVRGITPDIFYGTYVPAPEDAPAGTPRLVQRLGLADCLSVYGSRDRVDANTAPFPVLVAVGLSPEAANAIIARRRMPFTEQQLNEFMNANGIPSGHLRLEGNSIATLRATARLRLENGQLSDLERSVAMQVKYMQPGTVPPVAILRWYDTSWSN